MRTALNPWREPFRSSAIAREAPNAPDQPAAERPRLKRKKLARRLGCIGLLCQRPERVQEKCEWQRSNQTNRRNQSRASVLYVVNRKGRASSWVTTARSVTGNYEE